MALFDMCIQLKMNVVAAHVNYHHRPSADRDEKIVREMCEKHQIPFELCSPGESTGNFQNWAREVRYQFFCETAKKYGCEGVLVAHHEDDVIETILFQRQRGIVPDFYGIQEKTELFGCKVFRPLLNQSKKSLKAYCDVHQIPYGHDETNDSDEYERNRIRHHQVEKMTASERQEVLLQARVDNVDLMVVRQMVDVMIERYPHSLPVDVFDRLPQMEKIIYLRTLIRHHLHTEIGTRQCEDLIRQLSCEGNVEILLDNCVKLSKMYHLIEIYEAKDVLYTYVLEKLELMETDYFKVAEEGKSTEAVTLTEDDFPLMIRNARKGDAIQLRFGSKKLNRWFIDRKIPRNQRQSWPVVCNRYNEVILVPGIGCDVEHYSNNPTCFVIK